MDENKALTITNDAAMMPIMEVSQAVERYDQFKEFVGRILKSDTDYGIIPGTKKKTLFKPGAEKLSTFFGLSKRFEIVERVEDWTGKDHDGEPFFYYLYRCSLFRGDLLIAESDGSCNSWEVKYRWRKQERVCPKCQAENIRKSKTGGWYCWAKTGGCGETYKDGDPAIEGQEVGRKPNPDIADQVNTFQKMAQKRALVAAVLIAVNASDYFTQDIEDFSNVPLEGVIEGEFEAATKPPAPKPQPKSATRKTQSKPAQTAPVPGFPAMVAEVNKELGRDHYNVYRAQNAIKQVIDDFQIPAPDDTEALAGAKQILLDHANAPG